MADIQKTPFVRELASSDRRTRDKALESLTLFLRSRSDLSLLELLKLWKGLFFCFYHSDRPLTQQALARALSYSLVPTLPRPTLHRFLRAFWITIGRDFHSLDRLRLDKYLYLIRCYVGVAFEVFLKGKKSQPAAAAAETDSKKRKRAQQSHGKNTKKVKGSLARKDDDDDNHDDDSQEDKWAELSAYLSIIEEGPLYPLNFDPEEKKEKSSKNQRHADDHHHDRVVPMPHGPDGLRYHIMDIWLDEIEKVIEFEDDEGNAEEEEESTTTKKKKVKGDVPMDLLLRPIEKLLKESPYKPVRTRATDVVEDERLVEWGFRERKVDEDEDDSEEEWGGFD